MHRTAMTDTDTFGQLVGGSMSAVKGESIGSSSAGATHDESNADSHDTAQNEFSENAEDDDLKSVNADETRSEEAERNAEYPEVFVVDENENPERSENENESENESGEKENRSNHDRDNNLDEEDRTMLTVPRPRPQKANGNTNSRLSARYTHSFSSDLIDQFDLYRQHMRTSLKEELEEWDRLRLQGITTREIDIDDSEQFSVHNVEHNQNVSNLTGTSMTSFTRSRGIASTEDGTIDDAIVSCFPRRSSQDQQGRPNTLHRSLRYLFFRRKHDAALNEKEQTREATYMSDEAFDTQSAPDMRNGEAREEEAERYGEEGVRTGPSVKRLLSLRGRPGLLTRKLSIFPNCMPKNPESKSRGKSSATRRRGRRNLAFEPYDDDTY